MWGTSSSSWEPQRTQRTRRKLEGNSFNAFCHFSNVEVRQYRQSNARCPKVRDALRGMNGGQRVDSFGLQHHSCFITDNEVKPSISHLLATIVNRYLDLPLERNPTCA